jgi:peptidoglycan/LPS O-acetylase OafA/YrhL
MPSEKAPMGVMLASVLARAVVCWVVAFGAAFCSWHVLEKWFVGLKSHFAYKEPITPPAQPEAPDRVSPLHA